MQTFRIATPTRTCDKTYVRYGSYKKYLVKDFFNRCGYCDGSDTWVGGYRSYHIDHFAPKDKFPTLETTYTNLIYACPSCNNAKSNKWPSIDALKNIVDNKGFLNPVNDNLNDHFERDDMGRIIGKSDIANDMIINLNLHLERHSIIWMLTKLERLIQKYEQIILGNKYKTKKVITLEGIHYSLLKIFFDYQTRLKTLNL